MSSKDLQIAKRLARQQRLERERLIGRPRAKSFGGKPDNRSIRRSAKADLRKGNDSL